MKYKIYYVATSGRPVTINVRDWRWRKSDRHDTMFGYGILHAGSSALLKAEAVVPAALGTSTDCT